MQLAAIKARDADPTASKVGETISQAMRCGETNEGSISFERHGHWWLREIRSRSRLQTQGGSLVTSPNLRLDIYDPVRRHWHMLRANDRFRYPTNIELRIAIGKKLLNLVADGVTDPLRLRNLTVESLTSDTSLRSAKSSRCASQQRAYRGRAVRGSCCQKRVSMRRANQGRNRTGILFSRMVAATMIVAASAAGWKAEATAMTGVGALPLQLGAIRPLKRLTIGADNIAEP